MSTCCTAARVKMFSSAGNGRLYNGTTISCHLMTEHISVHRAPMQQRPQVPDPLVQLYLSKDNVQINKHSSSYQKNSRGRGFSGQTASEGVRLRYGEGVSP